ncbi:hypothetical protein H4R33_002137 [Dimargaris cristalligena]|nr:hypothetical protein H4R33_002137 [Dimargaris cristalligena]
MRHDLPHPARVQTVTIMNVITATISIVITTTLMPPNLDLSRLVPSISLGRLPTPHHLINERTANPVEEVVPADFLDALTYEVVKNPQRLPSGNMCIPMSWSDIRPDLDLQKRIEAWRRDRDRGQTGERSE